MQTTHTPGPWSLSDEDGPLLSGADGAYIAQVFSRTGCDNGSLRPAYAADARLIASAPALLAALQEIANYDPTKWDAATLGNIARAAIARATGED